MSRTVCSFLATVTVSFSSCVLLGCQDKEPPNDVYANRPARSGELARLIEDLESSDTATRKGAQHRLFRSGPDTLRELLNDPDPQVRLRALQLISSLNADAGATHLVPLLGSADEEIRMRAALALGRDRHQAALPVLIDAVKNIEYVYWRVRAFDMMNRYAFPAMHDRLVGTELGSDISGGSKIECYNRLLAKPPAGIAFEVDPALRSAPWTLAFAPLSPHRRRSVLKGTMSVREALVEMMSDVYVEDQDDWVAYRIQSDGIIRIATQRSCEEYWVRDFRGHDSQLRKGIGWKEPTGDGPAASAGKEEREGGD